MHFYWHTLYLSKDFHLSCSKNYLSPTRDIILNVAVIMVDPMDLIRNANKHKNEICGLQIKKLFIQLSFIYKRVSWLNITGNNALFVFNSFCFVLLIQIIVELPEMLPRTAVRVLQKTPIHCYTRINV